MPHADRPAPDRLLLVGMMGAGKSTVAQALAARLGWPTLDTDTVVEAREGASVAVVWREKGESAFRSAESAVVEELKNAPLPLVVSVGGGAVLSEANRQALRRAGTVVWLRARPASLVARVGGGEGRPLLAGGPLESSLERLLTEREALYWEVADVVVDVDELSPSEIAERLCES
ncbi:MAG TPA: shikimate kinase [Acidimicrobiales bacterium]|nr:shikimate kinase [Acidimicrobiales bacterium]